MGILSRSGRTVGQTRNRGVVSPTALSGDVNDYNPTNLVKAGVLRLDGGASNRNITGLAGGISGRTIRIVNIGTTNTLVLVDSSSSSTAANRFLGPNGDDITVYPNGFVDLWYDGTSARWRGPSKVPEV